MRLRLLFVGAAAAGRGDPREIADAFDWAYEQVQSAHPLAASRLGPNQVEHLVDGALDMIREMQLLNLDLQAEAVVPYERDSRDRLRAVIRDGLAEPLDRLRMLQQLCLEAGMRFHHEEGKPAALHESLARLQARAVRTTDEVIHLVEGGYASAAMARWRTLHEIEVVARLLAEHGEDTAQRYLDHQWVELDKSATMYAKHQPALGGQPLSDEQVAVNRDLRDEAVVRHGEDLQGSRGYGWAKHVVPDANLGGIEKAVGLGHLRPYYAMASHSVHTSARNVIVDGASEDGSILRVGPDVDGLVDPVQLTTHALVAVTRAFVFSAAEEDLIWLLYVRAAERQAERIVEALPATDDLIDSADAEIPLPTVDDQSLITWQTEGLDQVIADLEKTLRRQRRSLRTRSDRNV